MFRKDNYDKKDNFRYHLHLSYLFGFIIFFLLVMLLVIFISKSGCSGDDLICSNSYSVVRHDVSYCDSLSSSNNVFNCYNNFIDNVTLVKSDCDSMSLDLVELPSFDVFVELPKVRCYSKVGFDLNEMCDLLFDSDLSLKCKYMYG